MTMSAAGVAKLIEECGELQQILAKKLAYWWTDEHPDGAGPMSVRMENEMGDVLAAIEFASSMLGLDRKRIAARSDLKLGVFCGWHLDPNNNHLAIDGDPSKRDST